MSFIETRTGKRFEPLAPAAEDIRIEDIAHALANQCRFSGHTKVHYSVAEHSVRVSELLEACGYGNGVQLWALLHDASEAYLVDIPSPLKALPEFAPYRAAEARLMAAICDRFGLPREEPAAVRVADETLLATEARDLMAYRPEHWGKLREQPLDEVIVPWGTCIARRNFLARFEGLVS